MFTKKRLFCIFITLILIIIAPFQALAMQPESTTIKINEFEQHKALMSKSDAELSESGLSDNEIKKIREIDFFEIYLERSKLDKKQLKAMGYTNKQIKVLKDVFKTYRKDQKEYKKSQIEPHKRTAVKQALYTAGVFADLTMTSYVSSSSKSYIRVGFTFEWTNKPISMDAIETIAASWTASDIYSSEILTALNTSYSYVNVYMYDTLGPLVQSRMYRFKPVEDPYHRARVDWEIADTLSTNNPEFPHQLVWAKKGYGYIRVDTVGHSAYDIDEIALSLKYGHTVFGITKIDFGWPASIGISFSYRTYDMDEIIARYDRFEGKLPYN